MKYLNKILVALIMVVGLGSHAQDSENLWAVSSGFSAVDYRSSAGGGNNFFENHFSQLFSVNKNWNAIPFVSYINVSRYFGYNVSVKLGGSVNKISKFITYNPLAPEHNSAGMEVTNPGELKLYEIDAVASYSFMSLINSKKIDPTFNLGTGYTFLGKQSYATVDMGLGLNFWFTKKLALALAGTYNWAAFSDARQFANAEPDSPSYVQWLAGVTFKFGGKDTDGDGTYDKDDACPEVAGLKQFKGCPDTDTDGIVDGSDECPDVVGLAALNGCPDADGDGVADSKDACLEIAGLAALNGCPDADGDGTADKDDKCPAINGPKENEGCPWSDTDEDKVLDKDDKCPEIKGTIENNGCPEVSEEMIKKLDDYAKTILFNSGKSTFKARTFPVLQSIAAILEEYPESNFSIEGHTDTDGNDEANLALSKQRAAAVKDYLIQNGIASQRLTSEGYGETRPIASNKIAKGKAINRRVEVKLIK